MNIIFIKYLCLCLGWYCLWKAVRVYCLSWYKDKVKDGINQTILYLDKLSSDVQKCETWQELVLLAKRIPNSLTYDITIQFGSISEPYPVDFEYCYDLINKIPTVNVIMSNVDDINHNQFTTTREQLLNEIRTAIEMLKKDS